MEHSQMKVKSSIKVKLLSFILPILIVLILGLIVISYFRSKAIIEEEAAVLLSTSGNNQSKQIESWLSDNLAHFTAAKAALEGVSGDSGAFQEVLDSYYSYNSNFPEGLYVGTVAGDFYKATDSSLDFGSDITGAPWFEEGLAHVNMTYGKPHASPEGDLVISATGILMDGSDVMKVLAADVSIDRINIIVNSLIEMESAESLLLNRREGTILAHWNSDIVSDNISAHTDNEVFAEVASALSDQKYGFSQTDDYMVYLQAISGTEWALASYVPIDVILADLTVLRNFMVIVAIISIILISVIIERLVHRMIKPVKNLTKTIVTMSNGDFTVDVDVKGNDEISVMSDSVKYFIGVMRDMIGELTEIAQVLREKARNSNDISSDLFNTSNTQAESMGNLNQTVEELARSVNEIAESAQSLSQFVSNTTEKGSEVTEMMTETVTISEQGQQDMEQVKVAMDSIREAIHELKGAVDQVGKASDEITDIVSLIGSIAEETNLLALNASIEAARAGDAGKGFAVVALEIGKLAGTSAEAVKNISKLTSDVQRLVTDAVKQADDSGVRINNSSEQISQAAVTFDTIFAAIGRTNNIVGEMIKAIAHVDEVATNVAAISEEQAASSEEILSTSEMMLLQSTTIADSSKNMADDAQSLTDTASELAHQVDLFQV